MEAEVQLEATTLPENMSLGDPGSGGKEMRRWVRVPLGGSRKVRSSCLDNGWTASAVRLLVTNMREYTGG